MARSTKAKIIPSRPADANNRVVTTLSDNGSYMRSPCLECPWRTENAGSFPAEAFRHSANTAEDGAGHLFGCHMSGVEHPATCAGFLLKNAHHNMAFRAAAIAGRIDLRLVTDGGADLFNSYREMAEANGVPHNDPALRRCRGDME